MKKILAVFLCLTVGSIMAQENGTVKGTVLDLEMGNEPLLLAHVSLQNTVLNTQTNFHGNFEITDINSGHYVLLISYAGYETLELPIEIKENKTTVINGGLKAMRVALDDVVGLNPVSTESFGTISNLEKSLRP